MTEDLFDVAIVGAGAAGLMAAIFAGRSGARVVALDGAAKIGAKILVAGGGRCNVTHEAVTPDDFNGTNRNLIAKVLRSFDVGETIDFFREIGVELKREETGKLFPVTDRARTVLDALLGEAARTGAEIRDHTRVERVEWRANSFTLHTHTGVTTARRVILATGGKSLPKTGSDGQGYEIAAELGHTSTTTFPALVPLLIGGDHWSKSLKGVSADVEVTLARTNGSVVRRLTGAMLFAHFGLTGPVILDVSRHWIAERLAEREVALTASFVPGRSFEEVDRWIRSESSARPRASVGKLLRSRLTERLADELLKSEAGVDASTMLGQLSKERRRAIVHALTSTTLPVTGDRGFAVAEVTAGGVPLTEVDLRTMESRLRPGLHLCGEILDVDGRIGGFNFQWAWASGRLAGMAAGSGESG